MLLLYLNFDYIKLQFLLRITLIKQACLVHYFSFFKIFSTQNHWITLLTYSPPFFINSSLSLMSKLERGNDNNGGFFEMSIHMLVIIVQCQKQTFIYINILCNVLFMKEFLSLISCYSWILFFVGYVEYSSEFR